MLERVGNGKTALSDEVERSASKILNEIPFVNGKKTRGGGGGRWMDGDSYWVREGRGGNQNLPGGEMETKKCAENLERRKEKGKK